MLQTDGGFLDGLCTGNPALPTSFTSFYCFASSGVGASASSHTLPGRRRDVLPTAGPRHRTYQQS